jgi:hypothetical protein
LRNSSGSLAIFAAIRRLRQSASSRAGVRRGPVIHRVFTDKPGDFFFARMKGLALAMTVRIILILAVAIMFGQSLAYGSPACMTESEARAKFPKAHLYRRGSCWSDSAAYGFRALPAVAVHSQRPALAVAPMPSPRPNRHVSRERVDRPMRCAKPRDGGEGNRLSSPRVRRPTIAVQEYSTLGDVGKAAGCSHGRRLRCV